MAKTLSTRRKFPVEQIVALIGRLRGEGGCPWDKKQTPETMAPYLIEEVYELVDAIVAKDPDSICEEAGDALFQIVFVIYLYADSGSFGYEDVVEKNLEKMVRRHPHVFGDVSADTPERVSANWDKIKQKEKGSCGRKSVLDSIPHGMPALLRASKVSERAAKTGFDWDDISGVMAKVMEEWMEFSNEIKTPTGEIANDKAAMEFGDVLFTMVNVARFAGIHPETALIRSINKFEKRFSFIEEKALEEGRDIKDLSLKEMHTFWEEAKYHVD